MVQHNLTGNFFFEFYQYLKEEEKEAATIEKYARDVQEFVAWQGNRPVCKECITQWKEQLQRNGYQPVTINGKLSALNRFFLFLGWTDCRVSI